MDEIRKLTLSDKQEVMELWDLLFADPTDFTMWFFEHRFSPDTSLCLTVDGRIVSCIQGFPMQLSIRGKSVPAMMLSGVSTRPRFERRGYMHRVMHEMLLLCRGKGIPLVFDKPVDPAVYRSLGHFPCTSAKYVTASSGISTPAWDDQADTDALSRCYQDATSGYSGHVVRSITDMQRALDSCFADHGQLVTYSENGILQGYCLATPDNRVWNSDEMLACNTHAYEQLLKKLPNGTKVKLPADVAIDGDIQVQNVCGCCDIQTLLKTVINDGSLVFSVFDPILEENNGTFDGTGRQTNQKAHFHLSAGKLTQILCGYRGLAGVLPMQACYCVEEY